MARKILSCFAVMVVILCCSKLALAEKYEPSEKAADDSTVTVDQAADEIAGDTMPNKITAIDTYLDNSVDGVVMDDPNKPEQNKKTDTYEGIWSPATPINSHEASPWFNIALIPGAEWPSLTGTWWGYRDKLKKKGITFTSSYVSDTQGNPTGGRMTGARYNHSIGADLNINLEKLAKLQGLQFHISGIYRAGRNLSADVIGNKFTVSSIFGSEQVRLYNLYFQQDMFDNKFNLKVGRIAAGDDFCQSPLYWIFLQNGIDGCPISVPINFPFSVYPTAAWGARAKLHITDTIQSMTGVYNGDPNVGRMAAHGMDFTMRLHRGVLVMQEFSYNPNTNKGDKGLPGHYKVGMYWHTGTAPDLSRDVDGGSYILSAKPRAGHKGYYGMYIHADQMIYREGAPHHYQGLTPFACLTLAPANTQIFPFFIDGGLIYRGLIPSRNHDLTAFGFVFGTWSRNLRQVARDTGATPQKYELALELTYRASITKWLFMQPDIQYIIHPGGTGDIPNALVLGWRVGVTF
ncbi:carbohydrate porin [Candidatus Auribacterota bacterium]